MIQYQSSDITELIKAEIAARQSYKTYEPDSKGNYSPILSLDAVKACTEDALLKHGLIFRQSRVWHEGQFMLETSLTHSSGQWIKALAPLPMPKEPKDINQAMGAAMSYQRRYEAYGFLGLGKGDDSEDPDIKKPEPNTNAPKGKPISEKQLSLLRQKLLGQEEREAGILSHYGINNLADLPWPFMQEVLDLLDRKK